MGIIGTGFGQAAHLPAFRAIPGCTVAAIAASNRDRAGEVAARHKVPTSHGDWRELVERDDIDLVSIAVPPSLQPEIGIAAARHGKHLFCEKPLAATQEGAEALVAAARSAGIRHAVDFEFPELPEWREAGRIVHTGELGAIRELRISWSTRAGTRRSPRSGWKQRDELGGGALGGFASHALHHATWLMGALEIVKASLAGVDAGTTACDVALVGLDGRIVRIDIDSAAEAAPSHLLEVTGTSGSLRLENTMPDHAGPFTLTVNDRLVEAPGKNVAGPDGRATAVARLVARFVGAIRASEEMRPDLRDGQEVARLIEGIRAAARRERS